MYANDAAENKDLLESTTYTSADSVSVKLHIVWALRNIHR
jgi:hypothetical protein